MKCTECECGMEEDLFEDNKFSCENCGAVDYDDCDEHDDGIE